MSLLYKIAKSIVRLSGVKKMFELPKEELLRMAEKRNRRRGFSMPTDKKFRYADEIISSKYHCLKIETQPQKSKKALLFIFGGGYIIGSDKGDISVAAVILGQQDFAKAGIITALKIPSLIIGILLIIFGAYLWYSAVFRAKVDDGIMQNKLVTTGVYGLVRNPIYSAFMFFCTGALFISGNVFFYPLFSFTGDL